MARTDLLVITSSYPRFPGDWPGNFIEEFCTALEDRYVITRLAPDHPDATYSLGVERFSLPGGDHFSPFYGSGAVNNMASSPLRLAGAPLAISSMYKKARRIVSRRAISTVISHWSVPAGLCGALLRSRGQILRHIVVAHGSDIRLLSRIPGGAMLLDFIVRHCDAMVAVSSDLAAEIQALLGKDMDIPVIPMGVFPCDYTPPAHDEDGLLPLLFLGRVTEQKGAAFLPEIAKIPGARLSVAGPADTVPVLPSPHRYMGVLPTTERYNAIAEHGALLVPSVAPEGAPRVILEAMACGRPVIGFDVPGVRNLVKPGVTGLLSPVGDISHMKKNVIKLIKNRDLLYSLAALAHKEAEQHHWHHAAARFQALIDGNTHD